MLLSDSNRFDLGCGSGRWAKLFVPKVGKFHCIDPSAAIELARYNLRSISNCAIHQSDVDATLLTDQSTDFV